MYGLAPDKSVTVGVCLHFCSISESYIQTYKPFRHEELYNGGENCLQHILQTTAVETVDGVMIRSHIAVSHMKRMSLRQNSSMRRLE